MIVICFLFTLVDKKNDRMKFDIIHKTNEEYISVTFACIKYLDSYRFLSSSSDSLVKTLADKSHKTHKKLKGKILGHDENLNIVNEIEEQDRTIKDLKKVYPEEIIILEDALLNYMG